MWKCAKCETINEGETCLICGASREEFTYVEPAPQQPVQQPQQQNTYKPPVQQQTPVYTPPVYTPPTVAPAAEAAPVKKKKKGLIITIIIIVTLLLLAGGAFAFLEYQYSAGEEALKDYRPADAREHFEMISFYRDAGDRLVECDYVNAKCLLRDDQFDAAHEAFVELGNYKDSEKQAKRALYRKAEALLEDGEPEEAREIFEELGDYSDAESKIGECDYKIACKYLEDGEYGTAREIFESISEDFYVEDKLEECSLAEIRALIEVGNYLDAYLLLDEISYYGDEFDSLKNDLYLDAVSNYDSANYSTAKKEFEALDDYQYSDEYLRLIAIRQSASPTVSNIYDLIYFAPAKSLLMEDEYLHLFLRGTWKSGTYALEFETSGSCTLTALPITNSGQGSYKIEDGCHYIKESGKTTYDKQWSYTIIDKRTIRLNCVKNSAVITLYRQ